MQDIMESIHGVKLGYIPDEEIYPTEAALLRLSRSREMSLNNWGWGKLPTVREYITDSEKYHWDLSADVNFAYAIGMYKPEEICRRIERVFAHFLGRKVSIVSCLGMLGELLTGLLGGITYTVFKSEYRHVDVYAKLMFWLQAKEHEYGYEDALDLED